MPRCLASCLINSYSIIVAEWMNEKEPNEEKQVASLSSIATGQHVQEATVNALGGNLTNTS